MKKRRNDYEDLLNRLRALRCHHGGQDLGVAVSSAVISLSPNVHMAVHQPGHIRFGVRRILRRYWCFLKFPNQTFGTWPPVDNGPVTVSITTTRQGARDFPGLLGNRILNVPRFTAELMVTNASSMCPASGAAFSEITLEQLDQDERMTQAQRDQKNKRSPPRSTRDRKRKPKPGSGNSSSGVLTNSVLWKFDQCVGHTPCYWYAMDTMLTSN